MIHANELLGKTVIDASGKYIGEVEELDIARALKENMANQPLTY